MKKQSCLLAAALLALSLTACSAPSASVAETVYKPPHIEQTEPTTPPDTAENSPAFADVALSFSVGDKAEKTDTTENAADSVPETLSQDVEAASTTPAPQEAVKPTEKQAGATTSPVLPSTSAGATDPEQNPAPAEPSVTVDTPATMPEPSPAQPPQPEQPPAQNTQPDPVPDPMPAPDPALDPAPTQPVDIDAILQQAQAYGLSLGLEWDATATDCWDNPIAATPQSLYVLRDLCARLDWYCSSGFEAFYVWSESTGDDGYLVYVGYA